MTRIMTQATVLSMMRPTPVSGAQGQVQLVQQMTRLVVKDSLADLQKQDDAGGGFLFVHPGDGSQMVGLNKSMIVDITVTDLEQEQARRVQAQQQEGQSARFDKHVIGNMADREIERLRRQADNNRGNERTGLQFEK